MTEIRRSDNPPSAHSLSLPDAELRWWQAWLSARGRDYLHQHLLQLSWQQPSIWVFGRLVQVPRRQIWMGDAHCAYRYSGVVFEPQPWTDALHRLTARVSEATGFPFNCVLLNWYQDGSEHMGWHSDDEPELGANPVVASLSLGQTRRFDLRHKTLDCQLQLPLADGDLLLMAGACQPHWQHAVPKQMKITQSRYSLTFRYIAP